MYARSSRWGYSFGTDLGPRLMERQPEWFRRWLGFGASTTMIRQVRGPRKRDFV